MIHEQIRADDGRELITSQKGKSLAVLFKRRAEKAGGTVEDVYEPCAEPHIIARCAATGEILVDLIEERGEADTIPSAYPCAKLMCLYIEHQPDIISITTGVDQCVIETTDGRLFSGATQAEAIEAYTSQDGYYPPDKGMPTAEQMRAFHEQQLRDGFDPSQIEIIDDM